MTDRVLVVNRAHCQPFAFYLSDNGSWQAETLLVSEHDPRRRDSAVVVRTQRVHWTMDAAAAELLKTTGQHYD